MMLPEILPYPKLPVTFQVYDPRYDTAAQRVIDLITSRLPGVVVEPIGSTAVPNCGGRGVIDLMILYADSLLDVTVAELTTLGFQWIARDEEEWPKGLGAIMHDNDLFRLHIHVLPFHHPAAHAFRTFRDRLRSDPNLVAAYVAHKQAILASGLTDPIGYTAAKRDFIASRD